MRRFVAAGLSMALQLGAFQAPLMHAHLDDHEDDHHHARAVHAHFGGHSHPGPAEAGQHDGPVVAAPEEQTTRLQTFVAVKATAPISPALPPAVFTPIAPIESAMRRPPELVRSHSPPDVACLAPRAPPTPSV